MLKLYHNDMSSCAQKVRLCLAEKGLEWESKHLDLRAGEHQQPWYVKLNPRAVVPTLIDGDIVIPESNVINEYLDERFPNPPLKPGTPFGRAKMRLWTKQLDEGVHDAGIAVISFALAFRQQYLSRGEAGKKMLENIPDPIKRERRRDVIEKGLDSIHFSIAIARMLALYDDMEDALAEHRFLVSDDYTIADAAFTPYVLRRSPRHHGRARKPSARARLVSPPAAAAEFPVSDHALGQRKISHTDEAVRPRELA